MVNIIIASGYPLFVDGMVILLKDILGPEIRIGTVQDHDSLPSTVADGRPDLIVIDLALASFDIQADLPALKRQHPTCPVLLIGSRDRAVEEERALAAGAHALLPPSVGRGGLEAAIAAIRSGRPFRNAGGGTATPGTTGASDRPSLPPGMRLPMVDGLTPRQTEVLAGIARGLSNREIGDRLGMTEGTVKNHVKAVMRVLKVSNRTQAAMVATSLLRDGD